MIIYNEYYALSTAHTFFLAYLTIFIPDIFITLLMTTNNFV